MKTNALLLPAAVLCLGAVAYGEFAEGVKLQADGKDIEARVGHLVPVAVDFNGDGKKDLLVGQFSGGRIHLYLNKGTKTEPVLTDGGLLEAGGKQISLPAG